jgi:hypothetical protein
MLAIANKRVDVSLGDSEVRALLVGAGVALGIHSLGGSPSAFHLRPGTHRQRRLPSTQRGSGGETTGGAIVCAAGLEQTWKHSAHLGCSSRLDRTIIGTAKGTKQRQRADEKEHEQKHMYIHEAFSLLEMRRRDRFLLRRKNKDRREGKSSG